MVGMHATIVLPDALHVLNQMEMLIVGKVCNVFLQVKLPSGYYIKQEANKWRKHTPIKIVKSLL